MSRIQEISVQEAEKFIMEAIKSGSQTVSDMTIFFLALLEEAVPKIKNKLNEYHLKPGEENNLVVLKKAAYKNEGVPGIVVKDSQVTEYERLLKEKNVAYAKWDYIDGNCSLLMVRGRNQHDLEIIRDMVNFLTSNQCEINPNLFLNAMKDKGFSIINGLSPIELELFRYHIKSTPVLFSVISNKNNFILTFDSQYEKEIDNALRLVSWDINKIDGDKIKEQVQYRIDSIKQIDDFLENSQESFYVVDKSNPLHYIQVKNDMIYYHKQNKVIDMVKRNDNDLIPKTWNFINGLSRPVVMSVEDFMLPKEEKLQILDKSKTIEEFPEDIIIQENIQQYKKLTRIVAKKMELEDEYSTNYSYYDENMSFSDISDRADYNNQEEYEARMQEFEDFQKSIKYCQNTYHKDIVEPNRSINYDSLDVIIEKAERSRINNHDENVKESFRDGQSL